MLLINVMARSIYYPRAQSLPLLPLKKHKRNDDTARVFQSDVDPARYLVLLLLRLRLGPCLEFSNTREMYSDRTSMSSMASRSPD